MLENSPDENFSNLIKFGDDLANVVKLQTYLLKFLNTETFMTSIHSIHNVSYTPTGKTESTSGN